MSHHSRAARKAIDAALKVLDVTRIDLIAARRALSEAEDLEAEKTPLRPPSRTDMKAALGASEHFAQANAALTNGRDGPSKHEP